MSSTRTPAQAKDRKKIAVLGGGPAGLSAAYHLTQRPGWREEYEITVYTLGWRLGGKAASSRNPEAGHRIEEHGIHLFGNFYTVVFRMLDACYRELYTRDGNPVETDEPVTKLEDAFIPSNFEHCANFHGGRWHTHTGWLPTNSGKPWAADVPAPDTVVRLLLGMVWTTVTGTAPRGTWPEPSEPRGWIRRLCDHALEPIENAVVHIVRRLFQMAVGLARPHVGARWTDPILDILGSVVAWTKRRVERVVRGSRRWGWVFLKMDFFGTMLRGILADDLVNRDVDSIDGLNYRDWLAKHGASESLLNSALAQVYPNIGFSYPDGDSTKTPAFSAAPFVYFVVRQFFAQGPVAWFFTAGTGDSVVAPIYRALEARGVKFEFFTKVTDIVPSADGATIEAVECDVQATVKAAPYRPLYRVKRMYCWPHRPLYDQLVEGERLREDGVDLESWWSPWQAPCRRTLRKGRDFDYAVLAIPTGAFPHICGRLIAQKPRVADTSRYITAFPTQHVQIWLRKTIHELGWRYELPAGNRIVGATYNFPLTCYGDFTDLLRWEAWPEADAPKSILYFNGPMQAPVAWPPFSETSFPALQAKRVEATAIQFLRTIRGLLPDASADPLQPQSLDFDYLFCHDARSSGTGENRFAQQFLKANVDPNELYISALPGTVQFRPKAWESGYDNLALAGDWCYTGMNMGSIECAALGGALAAHALTGAPSIGDIPGYAFLHKGLVGVGTPLMRRAALERP